MQLPTGSLISELGLPARSEPRYWDAPANLIPRADAWFWACGCSAEPERPGRFEVVACARHREALQRRSERKAR
jgi:hypothetical protein